MNSPSRETLKTVLMAVSIFVALLLFGCGGGGGGGGSAPPAPTTFSISGTVAGGGANVTVTLSGTGAANLTTTTDANGNYTFSGLANGNYTVTPTWTGHVFSPVSTAVNVNGANVTGKNTAATANTAATYCLSGTLTGAVVKNVTVFLNGANTGSTVTDASGNYTFCGLVNGSYTLSALLAGYSIPTSTTITISGANPPSTNLVATVAPSGSSVVFVPLNPLPTAIVGLPYNNTVVSSITTSGGTAPYHYQSDTFANGAPPMGLIVDLNGMLTGTPRVAGTYSFGVCAVDMVGSPSCKTTSIIVNPVLRVSLTGTGSGSVTSSPGGISCGATCAAGIATGTTITLTATPATGSTFTGWSGACAGTGACVVIKSAVTQTVTATFDSQGVTGTWAGSFVWPGAGYPGCNSTTIYPSISLTQTGSTVNGTWGSATYSGPISGTTMTITGVSTIFGTGTAQTWTWDGANTIQAVVGYGCYDLNTLAVQQHGYYSVTLTRQ